MTLMDFGMGWEFLYYKNLNNFFCGNKILKTIIFFRETVAWF